MFVVHMAIRKREKMLVYSKKQAQIKTQSRAQIEALLFVEALTKILVEYVNYSDVFLVENAAKLLEATKINKHAIKLEEGK